MVELQLKVVEEAVEPVSEALLALDALSVSVQDADAHTEHERALFGEPGMPAPKEAWARSEVTALFATEANAQEAAKLIALQDFFDHGEVVGIVPVGERDWVRETQAQFAPVAITPEFWIVPSWHEPPAQARYSMRLDPGLAFGTGTHPTTRMCMQWLLNAPAEALGRVLDYGCGSGLLAIGAAMIGAREVDAVDIDPDAVRATQDNAKANQVRLATVGLPDAAQGSYQVVLANILALPLKVLAPLLAAHVAPGGHLVLAGLLSRQAEELIAVYAPLIPLRVADEQDGWALLAGQRRQ